MQRDDVIFLPVFPGPLNSPLAKFFVEVKFPGCLLSPRPVFYVPVVRDAKPYLIFWDLGATPFQIVCSACNFST